jgi:hypothetical protein
MSISEGSSAPQYDVALSFAGEDRDYVGQVARALKGRLRVFYDKDVTAELWGKDLGEHLDYVYGRASRYCVIFASVHYREKVWTTHERRSAQARAIQENEEYILPVRLTTPRSRGSDLRSPTLTPEKLAPRSWLS